MKPVTFRAPFPDGEIREADGYRTGFPGLLVAPNWWEPGGGFVIVHARSGTIVATFGEPEAALAAAERLGPLADWTKSHADMQTDIRGHEFGEKVLGAADAYGGVVGVGGGVSAINNGVIA